MRIINKHKAWRGISLWTLWLFTSLSALPHPRAHCEEKNSIAGKWNRTKEWYGKIPIQSGDERFSRIYMKNATLYHENDEEVALWGVNFQSAMSWEFNRIKRFQKDMKAPFDLKNWKVETDRSFDEIQLMDCDVIRIHLCPGDFADAQGNLVENDWLDMLDYTTAECYKRGIYINLSLLNSLQTWEGVVPDTFFGRRPGEKHYNPEEHKWELMVVPEMIHSSENYIRRLANRKNPYDNGRIYKHNPAWIIAEIINEPMWPKEMPETKEFPRGAKVFGDWRREKGKPETPASFSEFKYEATKAYLNRMDKLLYNERIPAVPCWNLYWSKGPLHQGKEGFNAAADSTMDVVSFSTYPGQDYSNVSKYQSTRNMLPYLMESYEKRDWQGWLREGRFKTHKARIVYEFEAWHNRSTYIYPAMAKYFRAQGAQVATMWTYTFSMLGPYMRKDASHNLSLTYTPRKAASFLVAGEVFRRFPRYGEFRTSAEDSDDMGFCKLSLPLDLSVYVDDDTLIYTNTITEQFIRIPPSPKSIVGYDSSPFVSYKGAGLYFLAQESKSRWNLRILPHFEWLSDERSRLDSEKTERMKLKLPGVRVGAKVFRSKGDQLIEEPSLFEENTLTFIPKPGRYIIK